MDDPLRAVTELLRDQHGIPERKLRPSARLSHDLGVDGDDVSDLLAEIHERFETDFSALEGQWTEFFGIEGISPKSMLIALLLMIPSSAATLWIADSFNLSSTVGGAIGIALFFGSLVLFGLLFPRRPKRPVTLAGLAEVIKSGAWPADPSKVR